MGNSKKHGEKPTTSSVSSNWRLTFTLAAAVGGFGFGGCGGPNGQFIVLHNQVPSAGCVIPADKNAPYQGEGVLDVRVPTFSPEVAYELFPLLENDLTSEGQGGVEPNRIALRGFDIDVTFVDGSDAARAFFESLAFDPSTQALLHYQVPWSGSVEPGGGTTSTSTNAFPSETARRLRDSGVLADHSIALVDAKVRAFGDKLAGSITSDVFTYPIQVCDGCLINSITPCPAVGHVLQGGVCSPGQDGLVDCCTLGADLICPATSAP